MIAARICVIVKHTNSWSPEICTKLKLKNLYKSERFLVWLLIIMVYYIIRIIFDIFRQIE